MKKYLLIAALLGVINLLCSPVAPAQTTRPLTVRIDTVRLNVCGAKTFLMGVGVGDLLPSDSVAGARVLLAWDKANIELDPQVVFNVETLGSEFDLKTVAKDVDQGQMLIEMGNTSLRTVSGSGKPLFFVKGIVKAPDTLGGLNGWVLVLSTSFESKTSFSVDNSRAGHVRVVRDTTPDFTGVMSVESVSFDTAQVDTVTLTVQRLRDRRVNEITFALVADTSYYSFVDTIETGTIVGGTVWTTKEVRIASDSIVGRLVAGSDLKADGAFLNVVLRRKTDSAFIDTLEVARFSVNQQSCLGKVLRQGAQVSAAAVIPKDTSTTGVEDRRGESRGDAIRVIPEAGYMSVRIMTDGRNVSEVMIFDMNGIRLPLVQSLERLNASTLRVRLTTPPPSGIYFVGLRGRNETVYKQFTVIK